MDQPEHAVAAVTHPDPYPYYAELVAKRPFQRDDTLGFWVAASAAAVTAVLTSELCRVRPVSEPVPKALVGTAAGDVFGRMVRMNDGAYHVRLKPSVSATVAMLDPGLVARHADAAAQTLVAELEPGIHPARIGDFAFRLPPYVVGALLGLAPDGLPAIAASAGDFVRGLAPGATAALLGNTLLALARHAHVRELLARDAPALRAVVAEVARHDAPVQNTRRFVATAGGVAGQAMKEGDTVLVLLAAANRDPAVNDDPARFEPARRERRTFTFGFGPHACPGETLAVTIAAAGVARLLATGVDPERVAASYTYRPSANIRMPRFN